GGRLEPLVPEADAPELIGVGEIEPAVRRLELAPGDLLLAASPALADRVPAAVLAALLERGSEEALPEIYLLTKDLPAFALLAVVCFDDGAEVLEEEPGADSATGGVEGAGSDASHGADPVLTFDTPPEAAPAPLLVAPPPLDISRPVVHLRRDV